jgi:hypothetical protein
LIRSTIMTSPRVSAATGYENTICRGYRIQGDTPNTFLTPEADLYMKLLHDKRELCQEF